MLDPRGAVEQQIFFGAFFASHLPRRGGGLEAAAAC